MTIHTPETPFPILIVDNYPVMKMPKRLTVLEAVRFKEVCHQFFASHSLPEQLILDFGETEFMDSSGVGALVHNFKCAQSKNVSLILYQTPPPVRAVLTMTGLDEIIPITATIETDQPPNPSIFPPETHPSVRSWIKRTIDIVGSLVGLGITAILFIPIAVAVKLDSPGPIFFIF